jgi:predicted Fe-S protein YdhL (DUF1289 family)
MTERATMSDQIWKRDEIDSPCVNICVVDRESRLCTGCLRSIDEIAAWSVISAEERRAILADLPGRAVRISKRRGGRRARLRQTDEPPPSLR